MSTLLENKVSEPAFANLSDWQIAEILNTPDPALPKKKQKVLTADVQEFLTIYDIWAKVAYKGTQQPVNETDNPFPVKLTCLTIHDFISGRECIDATNPVVYNKVVQISNDLLTFQLATEEVRNAFLALFEAPQSWAEANALNISDTIVGLARGGV